MPRIRNDEQLGENTVAAAATTSSTVTSLKTPLHWEEKTSGFTDVFYFISINSNSVPQKFQYLVQPSKPADILLFSVLGNSSCLFIADAHLAEWQSLNKRGATLLYGLTKNLQFNLENAALFEKPIQEHTWCVQVCAIQVSELRGCKFWTHNSRLPGPARAFRWNVMILPGSMRCGSREHMRVFQCAGVCAQRNDQGHRVRMEGMGGEGQVQNFLCSTFVLPFSPTC